MTIDITQIIIALIGLLATIITAAVIPWIKSKLTQSQWNYITTITPAIVQAAEIILAGDGRGGEKLQWAMDQIETICAERGVKIDTDMIRVAIENAWKEMTQKEKTLQRLNSPYTYTIG